MKALFLQIVMPYVQTRIEKLSENLVATFDFATFEQELMLLMNQLSAAIVAIELTELLTSPEYLAQLKQLGSLRGMRFKEYRTVTIYLATGQRIQLPTPYFLKASPKRGRKKQGPNGRGAHLGLDVLGFMGRGSSQLVSEVVKMAVLCPSLAVAEEILAGRGVLLDKDTIHRFCRELAERGVAQRGTVSLSGAEVLTGYTLVIGIDGGRLRERRAKRGRRKAGQKRQGYHGEWREPKLFTIYLQDNEGKPVKDFAPLHDATMGNHEEMYALLECYLSALPLADVRRLVFCGDGAPWLWSGVEALCARMGLNETVEVYQVLDFIHAQQNLQTILDLVSARVRQKEKVEEKWRQLLWNGDIDGLKEEIKRLLTGNKQVQALKKWQNYFQGNEKRMQYKRFKDAAIPCGSGCVESAIRRIINMRLKSAGTFWTREIAEFFLFLRSQLLSGRWQIMLRNLTRQHALDLLKSHTDPAPNLV